MCDEGMRTPLKKPIACGHPLYKSIYRFVLHTQKTIIRCVVHVSADAMLLALAVCIQLTLLSYKHDRILNNSFKHLTFIDKQYIHENGVSEICGNFSRRLQKQPS